MHLKASKRVGRVPRAAHSDGEEDVQTLCSVNTASPAVWAACLPILACSACVHLPADERLAFWVRCAKPQKRQNSSKPHGVEQRAHTRVHLQEQEWEVVKSDLYWNKQNCSAASFTTGRVANVLIKPPNWHYHCFYCSSCATRSVQFFLCSIPSCFCLSKDERYFSKLMRFLFCLNKIHINYLSVLKYNCYECVQQFDLCSSSCTP